MAIPSFVSFLLLLAHNHQIVLVGAESFLTCSLDEFGCQDGSKCISKYRDLCDGDKHCNDHSDEISSKCNGCSSSNLFKCEIGGKDVCLANEDKCDGLLHCSDSADELLSECGTCSDTKFVCKRHGQEVCLDKDEYMCNGHRD